MTMSREVMVTPGGQFTRSALFSRLKDFKSWVTMVTSAYITFSLLSAAATTGISTCDAYTYLTTSRSLRRSA